MVTEGLRTPDASGWASTATTVPLTDECMLDETKPLAVPIRSPTFTLSPLATHGWAGAPICCESGIITFSGRGIASMGAPLLILLSLG